MPIEVLDVLDPASWHAYGMVYGFVGNELLTPCLLYTSDAADEL